MQLKLINVALAIGGATSIATAVLNPAYLGVSFGFMGGIVGGAALSSSKNYEKEKRTAEADRVSQCFTALYEKNRGVVDPVEVSFLANCSVERAYTFLSALSEETNAQKINVKQGVGVIFNFPHTSNVLDDMTKNATAWAKSQTEQLMAENQQLQQNMQLVRTQAAAAVSSMNARSQPVAQSNGAVKVDPWTPTPSPFNVSNQ